MRHFMALLSLKNTADTVFLLKLFVPLYSLVGVIVTWGREV